MSASKKRSEFKIEFGKKYIAFNKPYAILCQFSQPQGSDKKTLAGFDLPKDVYPVGRLDYDSEGLLILSDDGRLNSRLLSADERHEKTYLACVENIPVEEQLSRLSQGVIIEGKKTLPGKASLFLEEPHLPPRPVPIRMRKNIPTAWIELSIVEGRNRQVRKMTAAIGCPTLRLVRIRIGKLDLFDLKLGPGEWLDLDSEQIASLFK